ncbi:DUF5703 domain-containing protein [Acidipila sp. EB88]|uniref:glycosyl hydrolase family 95 catalytic domain-containing protein n=1 Tax=Acidipila sp. EB88 TaxID=2305226 RepID=UPI000F5F0769|nr:DUF5703 domain-containing protein [Acidipila sp. EB88]RRA47141.1 glycoside hydrolase [Acidipila sp. EB88]
MTRSIRALLVLTNVLFCGVAVHAQLATSPWKDGHFHLDTEGVLSRSDIVLLRPNVQKTEAMPLGNGRLGLGVWSENGYTAQLNREDTWPFRLSPGQLIVPGLKNMTAAKDFSARLDLYDGEFVEKGGGMTAVTYVDEKYDVMVVEVSGADPRQEQQVRLGLWPGRKAVAEASNSVGVLSETWRDTEEMGASGLTFGSLSGVQVDAREARASVDGNLSVKVAFHPKPDGTFRVFVASPEWHGGDALGGASALLDPAMALTSADHRDWWHKFWSDSAVIAFASGDHVAEYFENLRAIDLFATAAENRDRYPGSQAGIGDLFSSFRDEHHWGPSAYWHWNLRMQVSANFGAGLAGLNAPYFNLYNDNMDAVARWTREHMGGRKGLCVPETMRFNGAGFENEKWLKAPGINCSEDGRPYYNARTISTGAEVSLWMWQQYLYTDDKSFLEASYPFMRESARFLLSYARHDGGGKLFTYPSNAHESNWDVRSPTTDISAMQALFPVVIQAATVLGIQAEDDVVRMLNEETQRVPALPLRHIDATKVLNNFDGSDPTVIIANAYTDDPIRHNEENIGLEPVWPYGLIGDDGPLHDLGVRTFQHRPNMAAADWSADPVQAAHLGLAQDLRDTMMKITERYQYYPNGFAQLTDAPEFYVEQIGVVADALQCALVQEFDGVVRVAPAMPADWDADGTVVVQHGNKVHLQVRQGKVITLGVEAAQDGELRLRNPWSGKKIMVSTAGVAPSEQLSGTILTLPLHKGTTAMLAPADAPNMNSQLAAIPAIKASMPKHFGSRIIGMDRQDTEPAAAH